MNGYLEAIFLHLLRNRDISRQPRTLGIVPGIAQKKICTIKNRNVFINNWINILCDLDTSLFSHLVELLYLITF